MILGYHDKDNKYIIGSKILYECENNYQTYGSTLLECQSEGYWSVNPPMCLPEGENTAVKKKNNLTLETYSDTNPV